MPFRLRIALRFARLSALVLLFLASSAQADAPVTASVVAPATASQAPHTEASHEPALVVQLDISALAPVTPFLLATDARVTLRFPRRHVFARFALQPTGIMDADPSNSYSDHFGGLHLSVGYHQRLFEVGAVLGLQGGLGGVGVNL